MSGTKTQNLLGTKKSDFKECRPKPKFPIKLGTKTHFTLKNYRQVSNYFYFIFEKVKML
jgi:hypothetical protein